MLKLFHGVDSKNNCVCKIQKKHFSVAEKTSMYHTPHYTCVFKLYI